MREQFQAWRRLYQEIRAEDAQVAEAMARTNLLRLRWVVATVMPLVAIYVLVFSFAPVQEEQRQWRDLIRWTLLAFLLWWAVLGVAVLAVLRRNRHDRVTRALLFAAPLGSLLFAAAISVVDQLVSPNISTFVMGAIFASLLMQMPTRTAAAIHAISCTVFLTGLHRVQPDRAIQLSNSTDAIAVSLISVLLATILWRKDARFIVLQRQLRATNQELHRQQEDLKHLAAHDALTGLGNRAELFKAAGAELQRAGRRGTPTSAIMVDLDHFKNVNDVHGHQAGDAVLVHVARVLAGGVRTSDLLGRMGGEEFIVVLPDTGLPAALKLADKLREEIGQQAIALPGGKQIRITASCGVSCVPGHAARSMDWLYASADHALYEAKRRGRDRVEDASGLEKLTTSDFQRLPKA